MDARCFARIRFQDKIHYALQKNDGYSLITGAPWEIWQDTEFQVSAQDFQLLAPVVPSKIVAVGLNYRSHALEMGMELPDEPLIFLKPPTALANPGQDIVWPPAAGQVDYEGELALVIGRVAKQVPVEKALDYVLGFTLANDITARDLQKKDGQWTRAKGFDGFCPLGPVVVTQLDWGQFELQTRLNDACVQTGKISDLIFSLPEIVAFISQVMTLLPGDVILTGTPPGIGTLQAGDRVQIIAKPIGSLENKLVRRPILPLTPKKSF